MPKILVPTDGSENAQRAGEHAISTVDLGSDIILLYVIDTDYLNAIRQWDLRKKLEKELKGEGEKVINNFKQLIEINKCQGKCRDVNLSVMIKSGKPADLILKTIDDEGVDEVIIGKSGKGGLEKFFVGSTTEKVVKEANVPVSVIS